MFLPTKYADDPVVRPVAIIVQNLRDLAGVITNKAVDQATRIPLSKAGKVSLMVMLRLKEMVDSILMLGLNGRVRDASILLLVLVEIELDFKYIGCNESLADEWIKHSALGRKPWKVKFLIHKAYSDQSEREAVEDLYRLFSVIKHGNPAAGKSSFPLGAVDGWLTLEDKTSLAHQIAAILYGVGTTACGILRTGIDILANSGLSLDEFTGMIAVKERGLNDENMRHVKLMIEKLLHAQDRQGG